MTDETRITFARERDALAKIRDELQLKAHLAKADLKDEIDRLETKWQLVENDLRQTVRHAKEPLQTIGEKTGELLHELKQGYESILGRLS